MSVPSRRLTRRGIVGLLAVPDGRLHAVGQLLQDGGDGRLAQHLLQQPAHRAAVEPGPQRRDLDLLGLEPGAALR